MSANEQPFTFRLTPVATNRESFPNFKRFRIVSAYKLTHNIGELDFDSIRSALDEAYLSLVSQATDGLVDDNDLVSVTLNNSALDHEIFLPPRRKKDVKGHDMADAIFRVVQSNERFLMDGNLHVVVRTAKALTGGKSRSKRPLSVDQNSKRLKSTVTITNLDQGCFYRALWLGMFYQETRISNSPSLWKRASNPRLKMQRDGGEQMALALGLPFHEPFSLDMCEKVQDYLLNHGYQLIIVEPGFRPTVLYKGIFHPKYIALEYLPPSSSSTVGHFNLIKSLAGYFNVTEYCTHCHARFGDKLRHYCEITCPGCKERPKCPTQEAVLPCASCNREFYSPGCFQNHLKICKSIHRCLTCGQDYATSSPHECHIKFCRKCKAPQKGNHYCYLVPRSHGEVAKEDAQPRLFVYYDLESMLNGTNHEVILAVAQLTCDNCDGKNIECSLCLTKEYVFFCDEFTNPVASLNNLILNILAPRLDKINGRVFCMAHNAKGFDLHFLFRDLFSRNLCDIEPIMQGTKILKLRVGNVVFLDSLAFLQCPLSKLPAMFGFNDDSKGIFPYKFCNPTTLSYSGPIPGIEHFDLHYATPGQANKIQEWHSSWPSDKTWTLKEQLIDYCKNDCLILRNAFMAFRTLCKLKAGFDPVSRFFTIASLTLGAFMLNSLKPRTIGITPATGEYGDRRKQSRIGKIWLDLIEKTSNRKLERERCLGQRFYVDGYHEESQTVYELNGCYFHGCQKCREKHSDSTKFLMDERFKKLKAKENALRWMGFNIISLWECEFHESMRHCAKTRQFYEERCELYRTLDKVGPLNIRDGFFGGRTNAVRFFAECLPNERIQYKDVCSLYPFVVKTKQYMIGHPKIYNENFPPISEIFGFIKLQISPPKNLYLPVLPIKIDGKQVYCLCLECYKERTDKCTHENRSITGTWTSMEIQAALARGYKIEQLYEVYHWPSSSSDLFSEHINAWLAIKQESSGWPSWCLSDEDKSKYIESYYEKEGIRLNPENIEKNDGLRTLAKLILNSFWGKFAQRANLTKTEVLTDYGSYVSLATDDKKELKGEIELSPNHLLVQWKYTDLIECKPFNTNLAIASFVTAYARLHLLDILEKVERIRPYSLLYWDTDSAIYVHTDGDDDLPCGDFLGDLTNEITSKFGEGARGTRYASLGPKTYCVEVAKQDGSIDYILKAKGITLSQIALQKINMNSMIAMAKTYFEEGRTEELIIDQRMFITNKRTHEVHTVIRPKRFRATADKRRITSDGLSFPYGY